MHFGFSKSHKSPVSQYFIVLSEDYYSFHYTSTIHIMTVNSQEGYTKWDFPLQLFKLF